MNFDELALTEPLLRAVRAQGYTTPTPIQAAAIPHVLAGRDLVGCAQTGTGKTAAFALPLLQQLAAKKGHGGVRVLVLAPTRELAAQIGESFRACGKHLPELHGTVVFGGVGKANQVRALRAGVDVLVATPGRLLDLAGEGHVRLDRVEHLVLDEADRMLDMGFVHDVKRVLKLLPAKRQTLLFSATMPAAIEALCKEILKDPARVSVVPQATTADKVDQSVHFVQKAEKRALLARLLRHPEVERAVVFTRTKHGANRLAEALAAADIGAEAIHGNKSHNARERALAGFKKGTVRVLVATDIAARGIDVHGISHVFNFDIPNEAETYVHRIGRTARAGAAGIAVSLCDPDERAWLRDIERLIRQRIPVAA
ncbi:MAG: DEAD/DEAH box helicase [Myxococcota bacterium]